MEGFADGFQDRYPASVFENGNGVFDPGTAKQNQARYHLWSVCCDPLARPARPPSQPGQARPARPGQ